MFYYEIAPTKIFRSGSDFLTYSSKDELKIGAICEIPVGKKNEIGVVFAEVKKPSFETKEINRVIENNPVPTHILELSQWMSEYYATPLAHVLSGILPSKLGTKSRRSIEYKQEFSDVDSDNSCINFLYTPQQENAIKKIDNIQYGTIILHGITGSGKTEVYINQAKKIISEKKSVIILVPEIALTSQLVMNFSKEFSNIKIMHSRQKNAERRKIWREILNDKTPQVIIGARSALFAPVQNLGLIVIDEAHEPTFKQEQTPKYSALRASSFLANQFKFKAIFGSATPLIEDYFLAKLAEKNGGNPIIEMTKLAKSNARPPKIEVVDLREKDSHIHRFFSKRLLAEMEISLNEGKQVLLYHNRRGSASTTLCHNCGWQALCPNCFLPLTLHADKHKLICHICGHQEKVPTSCPICNEAEIIHKGIGTKMIESEVRKLFPDKNIARFDADTDKDETVDALYDDILSGKIDIIIGTQVIAKGLDLPRLKTVGIVQADAGLALPDFTSSERNFQLIAQVIGRVGRHDSDTNVIVQTYRPDAPSIMFGIKQDYEGFYNYEIKKRKKDNFPPFVYLLKLTCVYKTEKSAIANARKECANIRKEFRDEVQIFGPTPAFYERISDTYRWQIVVKSKKRTPITKIAKNFSTKPHWRTDIDPPSLL